MTSVTVYVLVVIFLATVVRSTFGFGEALVAVPLLALRIPIAIAAPLAVLVSITVAGVIVAQDWRKIYFRSAGRTGARHACWNPAGPLVDRKGSAISCQSVLGAMIVAFSVYSLIGKSRIHLAEDSRPWLLGCGFCAGVLGGAYGLNGPPLVIYGTMRRWSAQHFRATLQGYFLPASLVTMAGYWLAGLWSLTVTRDHFYSLPPTLLAILLGRALNQRFRGDAFLKYVYFILAGTGLLLLLQVARP